MENQEKMLRIVVKNIYNISKLYFCIYFLDKIFACDYLLIISAFHWFKNLWLIIYVEKYVSEGNV